MLQRSIQLRIQQESVVRIEITWISWHTILKRLNNERVKFSGALGQCLVEYLGEYNFAAKEVGLKIGQKMEFIHHVHGFFADTRKILHAEHWKEKKTFAQGSILMDTEYSAVARQNCNATYLLVLRVKQFMKEGRKMTETLELVPKEVTRLAPYEIMNQRGEMNTIEHLCNAVSCCFGLEILEVGKVRDS